MNDDADEQELDCRHTHKTSELNMKDAVEVMVDGEGKKYSKMKQSSESLLEKNVSMSGDRTGQPWKHEQLMVTVN